MTVWPLGEWTFSGYKLASLASLSFDGSPFAGFARKGNRAVASLSAWAVGRFPVLGSRRERRWVGKGWIVCVLDGKCEKCGEFAVETTVYACATTTKCVS